MERKSCELKLHDALLLFSFFCAHFVISANQITRVLHLTCLQSSTVQLSDESDEENSFFFNEENKDLTLVRRKQSLFAREVNKMQHRNDPQTICSQDVSLALV